MKTIVLGRSAISIFRCVSSRNTIQNITHSHLKRHLTNLAEGQQCQKIKLGKNSFSNVPAI